MLEELNQELIYNIRHYSGLTNPVKILRILIETTNAEVKNNEKISTFMTELHKYNNFIHRFKVWE